MCDSFALAQNFNDKCGLTLQRDEFQERTEKFVSGYESFLLQLFHPSGRQPLCVVVAEETVHTGTVRKLLPFAFRRVFWDSLELVQQAHSVHILVINTTMKKRFKKLSLSASVENLTSVKLCLFFLTPTSIIHRYLPLLILHSLFLYHLYLKGNFVKWDKYTSEFPIPPELISITKPSPPYTMSTFCEKIIHMTK